MVVLVAGLLMLLYIRRDGARFLCSTFKTWPEGVRRHVEHSLKNEIVRHALNAFTQNVVHLTK